MQALNIFGERVKKRLDALKINQTDLAERLKILPGAVSRTLTEGRNPRRETVEKWAIALETTPEYLLGIEADNTDALRIACISAILRATPGQLRAFRDTYSDLFNSSMEEPKSGSSV